MYSTLFANFFDLAPELLSLLFTPGFPKTVGGCGRAGAGGLPLLQPARKKETRAKEKDKDRDEKRDRNEILRFPADRVVFRLDPFL